MHVASQGAVPARNARLAMVIGVIAFAVGAYLGLAALRFVRGSVPTTGIVVRRGDTTYTVQFEAEGRTVQFESELPGTKGPARSRVHVGDAVEVRYDPSTLGDARVAGSKLWAFPVAMMFIGMLGIVAGFVSPRR